MQKTNGSIYHTRHFQKKLAKIMQLFKSLIRPQILFLLIISYTPPLQLKEFVLYEMKERATVVIKGIQSAS